MGSVIKGIEYVYPERKVTNKELAIEFPDYDFSKSSGASCGFPRQLSKRHINP